MHPAVVGAAIGTRAIGTTLAAANDLVLLDKGERRKPRLVDYLSNKTIPIGGA